MSGESKPYSLEQVARTFLRSELISAIDETPGLIVPIVFTFAVFELFNFRSLIEGSAIAAYTIEALLATLVGLIFYCSGNFWDGCAFGPRYGINGTYLNRKDRPFGIFPAGDELSAARTRAATTLRLESAVGAYGESEYLLRINGQWKEVLPPIVLSKMARSFIWPALITAMVILILAITRFAEGAPGTAIRDLFLAIGSLIIAFLALIPYFELRVKHMTRVYKIVAGRLGPHEHTPADTTAAPARR